MQCGKHNYYHEHLNDPETRAMKNKESNGSGRKINGGRPK
jgi:hypothetical protein